MENRGSRRVIYFTRPDPMVRTVIGEWRQFLTTLRFPSDRYRIFSYGVQAHAYALGAQEGVSGAFGRGARLNSMMRRTISE